ncbi:MAG: hypothetical protein IKN99_00555 [Bacteroidales bacterium]|nr:hypothetical protein [Bacteroidales bacterium]
MKKLLLAFVMMFMAVSVFAQEEETKVRVPSGYQGFLEYGNTWTVFDKEMPNTLGLSTTHGFYFNGHMYAGIGIGFDACRDHFLVPIYGNFRYVFINKSVVSPFLSVRLGSYISKNVGAYGDLAIGVRFASKRDFAVSAMVAGTYYDKINDYYYDDNNHHTQEARQISPSGISLRIGIEW